MKGLVANTTAALTGLFCVMMAALAGQIASAEQQQALHYLDQTRQDLVDAVKGLSDAQWSFKPAADRWSIAQIVEHLAITEERVQSIFRKLDQAPAPLPDRDEKKVDALILAAVPDRTTKVQAPPQLVPAGRWSHDVAMEHLLASRQQTVSFVEAGADLRGHVIDHPVLGPLDGYEWALTVAAHTARHTKQILEVKADPHFPTK